MTNPLVSVLMTTYNREKYIGEAMESVLASTYTNFELIISDDCSKDSTVAIANEYASKDNRIKVFVNEKNLGDYPNRNKAASYAQGKYLKYVDADDYIYPWGLQLLVEMMEQFPEAGWGLCSLPQFVKRPFPFMLMPKEAYQYNYFGPGLFYKAPLSSIIKKETFDAAGGFNAIRLAGDFDMWHRLAQKYNVLLMPEGIVWYREHGDQESNDYQKYLSMYEKIKLSYLNHPDCPLSKTEVKKVIELSKRKVRKELLKSIIRLNKKSITANLKLIKQHYLK